MFCLTVVQSHMNRASSETQNLSSRFAKPKKCFKGVVKNNLRALSVNIDDWEQMIENQSVLKKWSTVVVKHLKYGESGPGYFSTRIFLYCFTVESVCPKLDLLVIWDVMAANNCRLIIHKLIFSNWQIILINSLPKYVGSAVGLRRVYRVNQCQKQVFGLSHMG